VILVDDGSRDSSAIVIEAKARVDKRFRLIKLSHGAVLTCSCETSLPPRAFCALPSQRARTGR
jgi:hypothetical protein